MRRTWAISAVAGALILAMGSGLAVAVSGEEHVSGPDADHAQAAATAAVPGAAGEVERERDEPGIAYGVEVTKPDGSRTDVHLNENFVPVGAPDGGEDD